MRVGLFDHVLSMQSPAGSCDVRVLQALRDEYDFTVFASELAPPSDGSRPITHVEVPTIRRPALASFLGYFLGACIAYSYARLRGASFDLIQSTDCAFPTADVFYAHFCHRAFLADVWPQVQRRMTPR